MQPGRRAVVDAPESALEADRRRQRLKLADEFSELRNALRDDSTAEPETIEPGRCRSVTMQAIETWNDGTRDVINVRTLQPLELIAEDDELLGIEVPWSADSNKRGCMGRMGGGD